MSDRTPAPVPPPVIPNRPLKASRFLWLASFALGLLAAVYAFLSRNDQIDQLRKLAGDAAPDQASGTRDAVASAVFWGTLVALVLIVVIEAILLRVMLRRHGGARWALLVVLLVHAGVALLAASVVAVNAFEGLSVQLLLLAQLASACVALVSSAVPGTGSWFRGEHQPRLDPSP
ncbi:MAG: hypothetical protein JWQ68_949 [Cryobacterium sp.]|jgi:hypothetical protein|nr:hypothetical protein [Cryobacterium sp.]